MPARRLPLRRARRPARRPTEVAGFDDLYARVQALKASGAAPDALDREIAGAGMSPAEYKGRVAQVRTATPAPTPASEPVPFDKLYQHVQGLKAKGATQADLDREIRAAGTDPDA